MTARKLPIQFTLRRGHGRRGDEARFGDKRRAELLGARYWCRCCWLLQFAFGAGRRERVDCRVEGYFVGGREQPVQWLALKVPLPQHAAVVFAHFFAQLNAGPFAFGEVSGAHEAQDADFSVAIAAIHANSRAQLYFTR